MKTIALVFGLLITFSLSAISQQRTVDIESELQRMVAIETLPVLLKNTTVEQFSSYDRKGRNNDGFEGTYSFVRKNDDGTLVIFDAEGKGVVERIWTPTPTDDTLDFYFDGASSPSYSIKFRDVFSGKVAPFLNPVTGQKVGGWYSYLPIPYSNGCKIVLRGKKMLFYQIQYRKYDAATTVKTFSPNLSDQAKSALDKLVAQWSAAAGTAATTGKSKQNTINKTFSIKPGETVELASINSGGRISSIEFSSPAAFEGLDNSFDLKITWDNESKPAVFAPVADFFGYAFGSVSMKSLLIGASADRLYSHIPMPFDQSARIQLVYRKTSGKQEAKKITSSIVWSPEKRQPAAEGKFYAFWKRESPAIGKPYVFLEGKGSGQLIGTLLLGQARTFDRHTEFFEGDDSTVLDDKQMLHGTGSEDYFNGGWYAQPNGWVERKGAPLHGCLDYSLPFSRTGGYRFYVLDKLPFTQSIYHSIEHGPEYNNREVEYTSIAMYYSNAPIANGVAPTNTSTRIFVPDTLSFYPRLMTYVTYEGDAKSAEGNATLEKEKSGSFLINTKEIPSGKYRLIAFGKGINGLKYGLSSGSAAASSELKPFTGKTTLPRVPAEHPKEMANFELGEVEVNSNHDPVRIQLQGGTEKFGIHIFHLIKAK